MQSLDKMVNELPDELRQEVFDFVEFLLEKRARKRRLKLKQDWAGALESYRGQYTSLDLEKKALQWRGD